MLQLAVAPPTPREGPRTVLNGHVLVFALGRTVMRERGRRMVVVVQFVITLCALRLKMICLGQVVVTNVMGEYTDPVAAAAAVRTFHLNDRGLLDK